jgi:hypothetical protein
MRVFRELTVDLDSVPVAQFISALEKRSSAGWRRDVAMEQRLSGSDRWLCFVLEGRPELSPVHLFLAQKAPDRLFVSNVISERKSALSYDTYNEILKSFCDNVVFPAANETGVQVDLSPDVVTLEDLAPREVAEKLRRFSASANKASGGAHPQDQQRWVDFITEAHARPSGLTREFLFRWLHEEQGWPEDVALELSGEYEFALGVLKDYERKRAS